LANPAKLEIIGISLDRLLTLFRLNHLIRQTMLLRIGNRLVFTLDQANAALFNPGHVKQINSALEKYFNCSLVVEIEPGTVQGETPGQRQVRLRRERQEAAEATIEADPLLQALITRFDGELDRSSIKPADANSAPNS